MTYNGGTLAIKDLSSGQEGENMIDSIYKDKAVELIDIYEEVSTSSSLPSNIQKPSQSSEGNYSALGNGAAMGAFRGSYPTQQQVSYGNPYSSIPIQGGSNWAGFQMANSYTNPEMESIYSTQNFDWFRKNWEKEKEYEIFCRREQFKTEEIKKRERNKISIQETVKEQKEECGEIVELIDGKMIRRTEKRFMPELTKEIFTDIEKVENVYCFNRINGGEKILCCKFKLKTRKSQIVWFDLDRDGKYFRKQFRKAGIRLKTKKRDTEEIFEKVIEAFVEKAQSIYLPEKRGFYQLEGEWYYANKNTLLWKEALKHAK